MTKQEYLMRHALILHTFELHEIDHNEYFRQIGELADKFGEEYEEGL